MHSPTPDPMPSHADAREHTLMREAEAPQSGKSDDQASAPLHAEARSRVQPHDTATAAETADLDLASEQAEDFDDEIARNDAQLRADGYTLTVEQVMQRMDVEGVSKSKRTVQQYMKDGTIDAERVRVGNVIRRLANEKDMARFIEDLKRREALALLTRPEPEATVQGPVVEQRASSGPHTTLQAAVLQEKVDQLEQRLSDTQGQVADLRGQLTASNEQVRLWADNAKDLKQLLSAQADMNRPVLEALAKQLGKSADDASNREEGSLMDLT